MHTENHSFIAPEILGAKKKKKKKRKSKYVTSQRHYVKGKSRGGRGREKRKSKKKGGGDIPKIQSKIRGGRTGKKGGNGSYCFLGGGALGIEKKKKKKTPGGEGRESSKIRYWKVQVLWGGAQSRGKKGTIRRKCVEKLKELERSWSGVRDKARTNRRIKKKTRQRGTAK